MLHDKTAAYVIIWAIRAAGKELRTFYILFEGENSKKYFLATMTI